MVITHTYTDPYIASRHGSTTKPTVEFKGTLKQCKQKMLDLYNDNCGESLGFATNIREATFKSKKTVDGLSDGGRCLKSDSQIYEILANKEVKNNF